MFSNPGGTSGKITFVAPAKRQFLHFDALFFSEKRARGVRRFGGERLARARLPVFGGLGQA